MRIACQSVDECTRCFSQRFSGVTINRDDQNAGGSAFTNFFQQQAFLVSGRRWQEQLQVIANDQTLADMPTKPNEYQHPDEEQCQSAIHW